VTAQKEMTATVAPVAARIESLGEPMSVTHVINTDLLDRLVEVELSRDEAAQVLAYYLPLVDAESPADSWKNHYLVARLHVGAAVGRSLGMIGFASAAVLGAEIYARRRGTATDPSYSLWSMDDLFKDLATEIDQLLDGGQ